MTNNVKFIKEKGAVTHTWYHALYTKIMKQREKLLGCCFMC